MRSMALTRAGLAALALGATLAAGSALGADVVRHDAGAEPAGGGARVARFTPVGTAKNVRRAVATFSVPMVPLGDPARARDPLAVECPVAGSGHWADGRTWVYAFARDLPAGLRCVFRLRDGVTALDGTPIAGTREFGFSTGGPQVQATIPDTELPIEEEQRFVLTLDAEPTETSVLEHAYFAVDGIVERIAAAVVTGEARDAILGALGGQLDRETPRIVLGAARPFPNDHRVRLVWGAGVAAVSGVATAQDQTFAFRTRSAFTATFECERESRRSGCIPLTPMRVAFAAPVAWEQARRVALVGVAGDRRDPEPPEDGDTFVSRLAFPGPFPADAAYRLEVPSDLTDDAGRPLLNAGTFPLAVRTDRMPPLAKFAARFGIVETKADPTLPVTIRNLEAVVKGKVRRVDAHAPAPADGGTTPAATGTVARLDGADVGEMLRWLRKVSAAGRSRSVFAGGAPAGTTRPLALPKPGGAAEFEVVGIPLDGPGLYVVELESAALGASLLEKPAPLYVPTAVLATNLAVHLKLAPEDSLVWVTALDSGTPVGGARVSVHDCTGAVRWSGVSDPDGIARPGALPSQSALPTCRAPEEARDAYFDYAQTTAISSLEYGLVAVARTDDDLSFVHSSWERGIEPYRFELPETRFGGPFSAHTILDRTLLRAGETVHMKHVFRRQTVAGFDVAGDGDRPATVSIRHAGSDERYDTALAWDATGTAETSWTIPKSAKLGRYEIVFVRPAAGEGSWLREWTAGSFRVEEFRVPLMRGTVQLPATPLVAASDVPVDVSVRYLAGGGASGAPVTLRALAGTRAFPPPEDFEGFTFANGAVTEGIVRAGAESEEESEERPAPFRRETLTLDANGTARATIAGIPRRPIPLELRAEIEYRDPSGEVQTSTVAAPVWPSRWLAGVKVDDWTRTRGAMVAHVAVVEPNGTPVRGAPVTVAVLATKRYSDRKRVVGGFYAYEHVTETKRLATLCSGTTDARGLLRCESTPAAGGEVAVEATVTDPEGRTSVAHADAYLVGREPLVFAVGDTDRMDVVPERRQYEPGETARFQVRMPFRAATALVAVEREGILATRVVRLDGDDPTIEVPVEDAWAPNMFVSVLAVRGRIGEPQPAALLDLGKPAFRIGVAEVRVGWRAHRLGVRVATERPTYHVRDTAQVKIAVRTSTGAAPPPGAEVAVAAVDEGLLELQPNGSWKLLDAMMGRRGYDVRTATAQTQVVGKRHYGRKAIPAGGGGGRQTTRELFDTLLLWRGRVPLDAQGRATVDVPLGDALTSFRIVAVATSGLDRFGTGATSIRTTQDLMLLAGVPPLVRSGDAFPAEVTVRNTTSAPLDVTVRGRIRGERAGDAGPVDGADLAAQSVHLGAGESRVVAWPAIAPASVDAMVYEVDAAAGPPGPSDHLRVRAAVRPAVPARTLDARLFRAGEEPSVPLAWPPDAVAGSGEVRVALAPRLAVGLNGVRDAMRRYPYECLEQQVSRAVALRDEARWNEIAAGLPAYLDADGLLEFFPTASQGSDALTAYVLAVTDAAGWTLPPAARTKMIDGLRGFVAGTLTRRSPVNAADLVLRKLAALDALARVGAVDTDALASIAVEPSLWPTSALLDWWSVLGRVPATPLREAQRREAEQALRGRVSVEGTTTRFATERRDALSWLMLCPDVNAVRLVHELVTRGAWTDDLPRLVRGTLGRQRRGAWECTLANAWGTLALDAFSARFERDAVGGTTAIALPPVSARVDWTAQPEGTSLTLPWTGDAALAVTHAGSGAPWITAQARAGVPLTEPSAHGLRVTRTVTVLDAGATAGPAPTAAAGARALRRGDVVRVRLEIDADADTPWAVVSDPLPGGASHVGTGLGRRTTAGSPAADAARDDAQGEDAHGEDATAAGDPASAATPLFVERGQEALRAYYELLPQGRSVLEYSLRLNHEGRFLLPPTRVEAMYAPEVYGELPNAAVVVER